MRPENIVDELLSILSTVPAQTTEFIDTGFTQINYMVDLNKWQQFNISPIVNENL